MKKTDSTKYHKGVEQLERSYTSNGSINLNNSYVKCFGNLTGDKWPSNSALRYSKEKRAYMPTKIHVELFIIAKSKKKKKNQMSIIYKISK